MDTHLSHDLWVRVFHGVSPLHRHHVAPHFDLAAHEPAASLSSRFVVFVLEEAEASVLTLVLRLKVEYDVTETLWKTQQSRLKDQNQDHNQGCFLPVTFENSSTICSLVLLLGIEPTNSRLLATDMQTPICFPGRIS